MKPWPLIHLSQTAPRIRQPLLISQCRRQFFYACSANPHNHSRPPSAPALRPQARHASHAAKSRKPAYPPAKSSTPFTPPLPQVRAKLNPPPETYAPELYVPPRKDESFVKYLLRCGRTYLTFYKQGISNVRSSLRLAKKLRAKGSATRVPREKWYTVLTRAEWQIVRRSYLDKLRLPAFGALVLIFGEWLPLLALYITPVVPEPCRIPAQVERERRKAEERRSFRERRLAMDTARLVARDRKAGTPLPGSIRPQGMRPEDVDKLDYFSLLSLDVRFGTQWKVWDWAPVTPPKRLLKWGLRERLGYLQKDDWAIRRDGGFQALDKIEVERACVERGIKVLGRREDELRKELAQWFEQ